MVRIVFEREKESDDDDDEPAPTQSFLKGSEVEWELLPSLLWENSKWSAMENPFTSWHGGEIGPWENMYKFFWGKRKDNSVVGFIAIVDNS